MTTDHAALLASAGADMALCTLVGLEGSFSRRLGAQLAIARDGRSFGSLSDGCLESQLASDADGLRQTGSRPKVIRYGRGSSIVDFRLPCGGGLDILIDPAPNRAGLRHVEERLSLRQPAELDLPIPPGTNEAVLRVRHYIPSLRILVFGEGPELSAFSALAHGAGIQAETHRRADASTPGLALGQIPSGLSADPWTAIVLLFHDHEWEHALLRWALGTSAFFIGAQGGAPARDQRIALLQKSGTPQSGIDRLRSPVGLIPNARDPEVLALSVLAEIVEQYQRLHPHP